MEKLPASVIQAPVFNLSCVLSILMSLVRVHLQFFLRVDSTLRGLSLALIKLRSALAEEIDRYTVTRRLR